MKKIVFLLLFTTVSVFLFAQTSVKIMDIAVMPVLKIDTVTGLPLNTNDKILKVIFKIRNIDQANKVHILFGTVQNLGDVLTMQADVIENAGIYYLSYNGNQYEVNGYTAQLEVQLSTQQAADYNYVTLYIEDVQGQETSRLFFAK